jgi:hypothetical protein
MGYSSVFSLFLVIGLVIVNSGVSTQPSGAPDLSFPKAVAFLAFDQAGMAQGIPTPWWATPQSFTTVLADTGTEVVWHALYWNTGGGNFRMGLLEDTISYVKAKLPYVLFQGSIDAYDYCLYFGGSEQPDLDAIYVVNSQPQHPPGYPSCWALDITKPKARQYVINGAEQLIKIGVDLLHFDCVDCLAGDFKLNIQPYVDAWRQIAKTVRDIARNEYHRNVILTINNGIHPGRGFEFGFVFPDQDYLDLGVWGPNWVTMMKTGNFEFDWANIKSQIQSVYGYIPPLFLFLDWGGAATGDLMINLGMMPASSQIDALMALNKIALKEKVSFVFPLNGGGYDSMNAGTYGAIKRMMNTISTVHNYTVTTTVTVVPPNVTITETKMATSSQEATPLIAAVVIAIGVIMFAIVSRRRN